MEELLSGGSTPGSNPDLLEQGAGVAWDFGGNGLVRGQILEREADGKFVLKFVNGKCYRMPERSLRVPFNGLLKTSITRLYVCQ